MIKRVAGIRAVAPIAISLTHPSPAITVSNATNPGGKPVKSIGDLLREFREHRDQMKMELAKCIVGQDDVIEQLFAALPDSASTDRIAARDLVYARARTRLVDSIGPRLRTYPDGWGQRVTLNNAVLLSRRVYAEGLDRFDSVYVAEKRDLKRAIVRIIALQEAAQTARDSLR